MGDNLAETDTVYLMSLPPILRLLNKEASLCERRVPWEGSSVTVQEARSHFTAELSSQERQAPGTRERTSSRGWETQGRTRPRERLKRRKWF